MFSMNFAYRSTRSPWWLIQSLEDARRALASADTHSNHAKLDIAASHLVYDLYGEFGPGTTEGMSQGDGSAVDIDDLFIQFQFTDNGQRLGSERLVEFDETDILQRQASEFQDFGYGDDRPDAHYFRWNTAHGEAHKAHQRLEA